MEIKAKLSVRSTRKGVAGEISWTSEEGKPKHMPLPGGLPLTLEMNGLECRVEMVKGKIVSLEVEGQNLMAERRQASPKPQTGKRSGPPKSPPPGYRPPRSHSSKNGGSKGEIYDVKMAKLPADTKAILSGGIENFNLQLNKAAPYIYEQTRRGPKEIGFKVYHKGAVEFDPAFSEAQITALVKRQEKSIAIIPNHYKMIECSIDWRLIIGLGHHSVYETSVTLHHLYGIPYIPGSALKGVTRSCYIIEKYGQNKDSEEKALRDPMFRKIFGHPKVEETEAGKGFVVFHDAFPITPPKIVPDVMNPHFGPYYSGDGEPPADYHNPVPVTFLTVQNTAFRFYLSVHDRAGQLQANPGYSTDKVLGAAKEWLTKAVSEFGVGAKTAVGYGYMSPQ